MTDERWESGGNDASANGAGSDGGAGAGVGANAVGAGAGDGAGVSATAAGAGDGVVVGDAAGGAGAGASVAKAKRRIPFAVAVIGVIALAIAVLVVLAFARQGLQDQSELMEASAGNWAAPVSEDNPALAEFQRNHPGADIRLACEEDITGDGLADLVVIIRDGDKAFTFPQIADSATSWHELDSVPAPFENQRIRFFDMDVNGILETLITGERDSKVGYAVYRITKDGEFVDVFGEGMEDCC